ncbi:hypothetical protein [Campylobacter gastrosuis]|uniref:Phage protein n=1 Tax=Campylobacter gastrosuis TaxID=2974576 RepID=A0ABT7HQI4_9BACT|nr:hypothetical protein [Campylobacter gastrosuis]MDL0089187.1 hypothetical protein [Campylobacter gastrosuis]
MKYYKKFKILQELEAKAGNGAIFIINNPYKDYGVSFIEGGFKHGRDYKATLSVSIDQGSVKPFAVVHFTNKGVKKLLKKSIKARARIDEIWKEHIINADNY